MDSPALPKELFLVLPLPPSINHQYATVNGRRVLSRAGRAYKALVAEEVEKWCTSHRIAPVALARLRQHCFALSMTFYFATAWRRDLDGGLKIAQDALCEALGINDSLVVEILLRKRVDRRQPRLELGLTALPAAAVPFHAGEGQGGPAPRRGDPRTKRRRRQRPRSLEELAARYGWA